ncbi:MAG TPA: right-handed parallel beta-helix repeat-containing protein [Methylomirabilota bacterium]|nr:right-handed parallel beta-helix repeat-containing protein [Methylomirabilota bacterium]
MRYIALLSFVTAILNAAPLVLHVAPEGSDRASGSLRAPFASLSTALNTARQQRAGNSTVSILLRGGTFALDEPLKLSPADSGLTIAAFGNEKPVVSGGRRINGWKKVQDNLWQADLANVREGQWYFRQLFINGQRATRARTPDEGSYFRMAGPRFIDKPVHFPFKAGDIKLDWANDPDVEVIGLEKWTVFRQHIAAILTESNVVRLTGQAARHTREGGAQYYVENARDALDAPGEWHLNRQSGTVSYLAKPGADMSRSEVIAPVLDELVVIEGDPSARKPVENITLRGLTFSHTDWRLPTNGYVDTQAAVAKRGTVRAEFARNITIEDCTFSHLANYAVEFGRGAQHCRIVGNEMTDLGAGGVRLGETVVRTNEFDASHHHVITDNHIHNAGVVFPPAVGVLILQSAHNRIAHNHIHDLFYTAVSVGWTWGYRESPCHHNVIEFNHMHDIGKGLLSDMGAVYTLGPQPGTVMRNNLIHDVNAFTYGGWGLYTDEGSTGIVMENNIVYRCKNAGFHQHYGKENVIRNNIFAFNKENQLMRSREEDHTSFYFTNNIVYFWEGNLLGSTWKNDRFVMDRNIYWKPNGTNQANMKFSGVTFEQWRARGHDTNSLITDPRFVDGMKANFRLRRDSSVSALGFQQINLGGVGVRAKSERD